MRRVVVVVGGGISGLAVAHALRREGGRAIVVEKEARAGGKIRTDRDGDFLCEWGPQSYRERDPAIVKLVSEVGLDADVVLARPAMRRRWVLADGRLAVVPGSLREILRTTLLSMAGKLRMLGDLVLPRGPSGLGREESVADFARRRLGKAAAERIFYPLVSGMYAADPEAISLRSAFPFLATWETRYRSLMIGAMRAVSGTRSSEGRGLVSFASGMEMLPRALAAELGPDLRLGTEVRSVARAGVGFRLGVVDHAGASEIMADAVVMASPAPETAAAIAPLAPAPADALRAIPYVPVTLVYAAYDSSALAQTLDGYGFLTAPNEDTHLLGAVFSSSVFEGRAARGMSLVSARLGGARSPELAGRPDGELETLVEAELGRVLGARRRPEFMKVLRHERALPQYTKGHEERVRAVEQAEQAIPGLYFVGAALRGAGVPDCVRNAEAVAARVSAFANTTRLA